MCACGHYDHCCIEILAQWQDGFATAAHYGRDRTGPEITKAEKFFQEFGSLQFKSCPPHCNRLHIEIGYDDCTVESVL